MNKTDDEQQIRAVIDAWLEASAAGDTERVLELMTEDAVFLLPGREPMRGREAFRAASQGNTGMKIEGKPDIQEVHAEGDFAYVWNFLSLTITPEGKAPMQRAGNILTVFRREADGKWRLFRDANMVTTLQ